VGLRGDSWWYEDSLYFIMESLLGCSVLPCFVSVEGS
jgi:hypothetical protein